jgi:uncharacterized protein (TIGR03435 family)
MVRKAASIGEGPEVDALRRLESSLGVRKPIRLVLSPDWMEPGIFGIFRPVLIWPEGISEHLDDRHIEAILAHEVCHTRRHDNLTAVLHMLVEAIFWFHPLVWWTGARLEEERERACDEEVSLLCNQPHVYAESILRVCKFCSESPLACVSGITGADLKKRIMQIMTERVVRKLDLGRKLLLLAVGLAVVGVPIVLGQVKAAQRMMLAAVDKAPTPFRIAAHAMIALEQTPPSGEIAQTLVPAAPSSLTTADPSAPSFDVATIKPHLASAPETMNWMGIRNNPDGIDAASATLPMLIQRAYGLVSADQVSGGPEWAKNERFDIQAKMSDADIAHMQKLSTAEAKARRQVMLQSLLAERFKLTVHSETRKAPVFELVVARGGPKLRDAANDNNPSLEKGEDGKPLVMFNQATKGTMVAQGLSTKALAGYLSQPTSGLERPVIDKTGLDGAYDFILNWVPHWDRFIRGSGDGSVSPEEADNLFEALGQIGLKLQPATAPIDFIVIDHVEKPTVDGADAAAPAMGQVGAATVAKTRAFDVASIRPNNSGSPGVAWGVSRTGYNANNVPLARVILDAYLRTPNSSSVIGPPLDRLKGAPGWVMNAPYDITAKADDTTIEAMKSLNDAQRMSLVAPMLRAMLEDRFKLVAHTTPVDVPGYALVVGKHGIKMKETPPGEPMPANGMSFGGSWKSVSRRTADGRQSGNAYLGITMAELTAFIGSGATPVVDQTGLTGKYNVELAIMDIGSPGGGDGSAPTPRPDIAHAYDWEAIGLEMKPIKVPVLSVVIDHIERPSEN